MDSNRSTQPRRTQYAPASDGGAFRSGRAKWFMGIMGVVILATVVMIGALLASKSCETTQFREEIVAHLTSSLQAEIEMGPISSTGIFLLETPEIRIRSRTGNWACYMRGVTLELDPRSLISPDWIIRSLRMDSVDTWIGHAPPEEKPIPLPRDIGATELTKIAQNLGLGMQAKPESIMVSSIRTSKLVASIGETSREEAPLILASEFRGGFQGQELTWEALDGQIRFRHHEPWNLTSLIGSASQSGIKISKGTATGPGEASIDVVMVNQEADGQVLLAVEGKNLPVAGQYINEQDNPLINLVVNASGQFHSEDLNFDTYLFTGRAEFTGIELGRLPLFQLLANQTGEDGFRAMSDAKATAEIEWEPGLLILKQLKFEEPGLLRLNGNLEAMETGLRGNLELALPAVIAGRFPGGKPSGFSYPAGGWSRAMVTVTGRPHQWNEDLTERLLAQVSTDLAISPLVLSEAHPIASDSKAEDFQRKLTREQAETYERYFDLMLDTRASEPLSQ